MYTSKEVQGLIGRYPEEREKRETHGSGLESLVRLADLSKALGRMPSDLRHIVTIYGMAGITARTVSVLLGVPKSTVSDRYFAGIEWIVQFLNQGEA